MTSTIKFFKDLLVWQKAHFLVLTVYKITKNFPKQEIFSLVDQMRRAGVSVSSNIAEGFSRQSQKNKINFYHMSLGSLRELENQIIISVDLNYLSRDQYGKIQILIQEVDRMLNGLIRSINKKLT
jgi:four helix bundle protein